MRAAGESQAGARPDRWKPVLLSALVCPGLGQLSRRRYGRALVFGGGTLALLAWAFVRIRSEALARLPTDPDELLSRLLDEPGWVMRLAYEIQRDNAGFFLWMTVALLALWAGSVLDAFRDRGPIRP